MILWRLSILFQDYNEWQIITQLLLQSTVIVPRNKTLPFPSLSQETIRVTINFSVQLLRNKPVSFVDDDSLLFNLVVNQLFSSKFMIF